MTILVLECRCQCTPSRIVLILNRPFSNCQNDISHIIRIRRRRHSICQNEYLLKLAESYGDRDRSARKDKNFSVLLFETIFLSSDRKTMQILSCVNFRWFSMSQKSCVTDENSGWIRKESSSRPNQFYYFNTKTGESRWDDQTQSPTKNVDSKNTLAKSNSKSNEKTVNRTASAVAKNVSQPKEKKILPKSRDGECLPLFSSVQSVLDWEFVFV